jgi:hypothetical protein
LPPAFSGDEYRACVRGNHDDDVVTFEGDDNEVALLLVVVMESSCDCIFDRVVRLAASAETSNSAINDPSFIEVMVTSEEEEEDDVEDAVGS